MTGRLLVATNNPGKLREFRRLLAPLAAEVVAPAEVGVDLDVPEPYETYDENARTKAEAFCRASGLVSVADDSGIEAAALDWGPGVRSARWAADTGDHAGKILEALAGAEDRRARMVCVVAVAVPGDPDPGVDLFRGVVEGSVAPERRGERGFGYDPIFLLPSGRTTAELAEDEKDRLSHRGRAVAAAVPHLRRVLAS